MYNQSQLISLFKTQKGFKSDYQLAQYWNVESSTINQYRNNRLRLPLALCLEIAETANFDPMEIVIALAYPRAKEQHKERLKNAYYEIAPKKIAERMHMNSLSNHYNRRRRG